LEFIFGIKDPELAVKIEEIKKITLAKNRGNFLIFTLKNKRAMRGSIHLGH